MKNYRRGRKKGQKDKVDGIYVSGTPESGPQYEAIRAVNSRRKSMFVSQSQFEDNWDRIFGK